MSDETKNLEEESTSPAESPEVEDSVNGESAESGEVVEEVALEQRVAEAEAKAADYQNRFLRAAADHENYRKRMAREKDELRKFAKSDLISDLLPALDNLKLGLQGAEQYQSDDARQVAFGFQMVAKQIKDILGESGLVELDPVGVAFDPNLHEATSNQPSEEYGEGIVAQTLRVGYTLNERLLRPATVIVSSGKPE
ncbi:MAG: nucleotide exchange factor GrpE [Verrucomicrobiota bacterium]